MAVKVGAISYAKLISLMLDGEFTSDELAEQTGLHVQTVNDYTNALLKEKAAHIVRWDPDRTGRCTRRVVKIGRGRNAKRTRKPVAQIKADYKERLKQRQASGLHLKEVDQVAIQAGSTPLTSR